MCGIAGIIRTDKGTPVSAEALEQMASQQRHRGPDDSGIWLAADRSAGLSHRRLSIVDLSAAGHQPMSNEDGTVHVVFNGEIYNHMKLRDELESAGHVFRGSCDTEVLVHLYEELGAEMVERLDGDFAFAIWDDRRKRLVMARDRIGVKPLYYAITANSIVFASELKAIYESGDLGTPELDDESLYHYLTYLMVPPPRTLLRGISKLPAGGLLVFERGVNTQPRVEKYWEPLPRPLTIPQADLDEAFEELFSRAVEKRLMSDVPVGVLFSGGVDSTLNADYFQQLISPAKVRTYTVGMKTDGGFEDECESAQAQAGRLGTSHHEIRIDHDELLRTAVELSRDRDEPLADPACVPLYYVARLARETGTIVLQAGEGADELFCGYDDYLRWIRRHDRFWKPLSLLPRGVARLAFNALGDSRHPMRKKIADATLRRARGQEFFMSSAIGFYENEKQRVLSRSFRESHRDLDSFSLVAPLYSRIDELCPDATFLQRMTFIELQHRLPELLLMRVDKMTMATSVETRVPFLDRDVVDFALAAPQSWKLRDGILKEPLKRLAARTVGPENVFVKKRGFVAPIQTWFRGGLGDTLRDILREDRAELERYFDLTEVERRIDSPLTTINEAFQLWLILNFALWRRSFFS